MVEYIDHFFGCRDCAENFLKFAENGAAIKRDVKMVKDSVLWLWKAHNDANIRLKGDSQTDDPVYPKTVFPDEQFCPKCMIEKNSPFFGRASRQTQFFQRRRMLQCFQHKLKR